MSKDLRGIFLKVFPLNIYLEACQTGTDDWQLKKGDDLLNIQR
jgi:hypothetical protein